MDNLFAQFDLSKFKVHKPTTLFEKSPQEKKDLLIQRRCLTCACRLYQMRNGNWLCRSKKHKLDKIVTAKTMEKYVNQETKS